MYTLLSVHELNEQIHGIQSSADFEKVTYLLLIMTYIYYLRSDLWTDELAEKSALYAISSN